MTLEQALTAARIRWGTRVTLAEQRYVGFHSYVSCFIHDEDSPVVRGSGLNWEEAFSDADARELAGLRRRKMVAQ